MASIGVILPTLVGREYLFDRTYAAFEETCPEGWEFDILVPDPYPTVGEAWNAGADELLRDFDGDYLFFAIDDAAPHDGWAQVAAQTVDAGYIPAARLLNADGSLQSCGSLGFGALMPETADCTPCRNSPMPFIRREWWHEVGEFLPIHYNVDDDWNWRASILGHHVMYRSGMVFTHYDDATSAQHIRDLAYNHHLQMVQHATTLRYPGSAASALADDPSFTLTHYPGQVA